MGLGLTEPIDCLVVAPQADAVGEVAQGYSTLRAKLALALAELDHRGEHDYEGYASMTAWCRDKLGWTNQHANRLLRIGRRLRDCPATADAWLRRELTDGQIDIIVACVTDRRARLWADQETDIVPTLAPLDVIQTNRALHTWAAMADAVLDEPEPAEEPPAEAILVPTLDGRGYLKGSFDAESTEVLSTALRVADSGDLDVPAARRQGQALVDVARFFLDHQTDHLGGRHRPHLNVVVDHQDLALSKPGRTLTGIPLSGPVIRAIACDANIHRVITDGPSSILDYGRATRTIPPAVYTSLVLRDWGCRFPGCDRPPQWCEGHHIHHWQDGGPTSLSNLALFCSKHHHVIHKPDWHVKLLPTGTIEITDPHGHTRTSDPPPTARAA